jgi:hypothetical protein
MTVVYSTNAPCLICTQAKDKDGYGKQGYEGKSCRAHRVAYVKAHGLTMKDIEGIVIRHTCDNPGCIEPTHLIPGTHADNMHDKMVRGRCKPTKGEKNGQAKLTSAQVLEIKRRLKNGQTQKIVAMDFQVSPYTIRDIAVGHRWKHI